MCFKKPKPDPKIAQEQARQEQIAREAKAEAAAKAKIEQEADIEREQEAVRKVEATKAAERQTELNKVVETPAEIEAAEAPAKSKAAEAPAKSKAAEREQRVSKIGAKIAAGRSRRTGSRGRRSLITGLGGGIGFYDRFG